MIKKYWKFLFANLGFEIRRIPPDRPVSFTGRSELKKRYLVEFIGPSGVGKSTICNHLSSRMKKKYYFRQEINRIYKVAEDSLIHGIYQKLLFMKALSLQDIRLSYHQSVRLLKYFIKVLEIDEKAISPISKNVILDEGLIHNFGDELISLNNDTECMKLLHNRVFINVYGRPEKIVRNIRSRQQIKGNNHLMLNPFHWEKTDEQLFKISEDGLKRKKYLVDMLSQAGSCTLNIDIENPLAENVAEVEKFLDVLTHNSD